MYILPSQALTTSESIMIKGVGAKSLCLLLSAYPMLLTGNLL
jgi:hypothetical protein